MEARLRTGNVTWLECSYILGFLETRGLSFLLPLICAEPTEPPHKQWELARRLVYSIKLAENKKGTVAVKSNDDRKISCEAVDKTVQLKVVLRKMATVKELTPKAAQALAVGLLQAAMRAA